MTRSARRTHAAPVFALVRHPMGAYVIELAASIIEQHIWNVLTIFLVEHFASLVSTLRKLTIVNSIRIFCRLFIVVGAPARGPPPADTKKHALIDLSLHHRSV